MTRIEKVYSLGTAADIIAMAEELGVKLPVSGGKLKCSKLAAQDKLAEFIKSQEQVSEEQVSEEQVSEEQVSEDAEEKKASKKEQKASKKEKVDIKAIADKVATKVGGTSFEVRPGGYGVKVGKFRAFALYNNKAGKVRLKSAKIGRVDEMLPEWDVSIEVKYTADGRDVLLDFNHSEIDTVEDFCTELASTSFTRKKVVRKQDSKEQDSKEQDSKEQDSKEQNED